MKCIKTILLVMGLILPAGFANSQDSPLRIEQGWVLELAGQYGRDAVYTDELLYRVIEGYSPDPERDSSFLTHEKRELTWTSVKADLQGWMQHRHLRGGYLLSDYSSGQNQIMILEANGHQEVYVNGSPRGGDVYGYGWIEHPVEIKRGSNKLLFHVARGRVSASLRVPQHTVYLSDRDVLVPDILTGKGQLFLGGVRIINATRGALKNWKVLIVLQDGSRHREPAPYISPLTSRKIAFGVPLPKLNGTEKTVAGRLFLEDEKGVIRGNPEGIPLDFQIKNGQETHKVTFISDLDGSVQYYAVVPSQDPAGKNQALFLSLHGASVEAIGQANAYRPKSWGTLVAPTNRRPYGFDWEDWGRQDAMEVLDLATKQFNPDPGRIFLTGHSMGGHGTWHLGVTYPGTWAAIAPSAGWVSFWSYGARNVRENNHPSGALFSRATAPSNTLSLVSNLRQLGVYILHGDQDDNVPVQQARIMRDTLGAFHTDFAYYERPEAGHWWGNECVDWPPLFRFFEDHRRSEPAEIKKMDFATCSPGISSKSGFVEILQQNEPWMISSFSLEQDFKNKKIKIAATNILSLSVDPGHIPEAETWELLIDSTIVSITPGTRSKSSYRLKEGQWIAFQPDPFQKNPQRYGGFKDAFRNRFIFVYGTTGSALEDQLNYDKARFDAETFWYRANGSVEVIPDTEYHPERYPASNVILYGNADTHLWFNKLLSECPVSVTRTHVDIGQRRYPGDDLAICFVYPHPENPGLTVGVIAGTGVRGVRSNVQNRYFISGSGYPDLMLFSHRMLTNGQDALLEVGYFGNDWKIESGFWMTGN